MTKTINTLISCSLLLFFLACGNASKTKLSPEAITLEKETTSYMLGDYTALAHVIIGGDTIGVKTYPLKNGYQLSFQPAIVREDTLMLTRLQGTGIDEIIDNTGISSQKYLFRYEGIDFEDYFCINDDGGSNLYMALIEKATGKEIIYGRECCYDVDNQLLIFTNDDLDSETELSLYDVKNKKTYPIYTDQYDEPAFGAVGTLSHYSIDKVTDKEVVIKFEGGEKRDVYYLKIER